MTTVSTTAADPGLARLVAHLVELIVGELRPLQVWLFGSRAEGRARPDSDYDLLVVLPNDAPSESFDAVRVWSLGDRAGIIADIVPCTRRG